MTLHEVVLPPADRSLRPHRLHPRGKSIAELADALEVPQGIVKSRLHHGLLALQENGVMGR